MKVAVSVPDERIYNLLCSANYGAIRYWVESFDWTAGTLPAPEGISGSPDHCELAPVTDGHWTITSEAIDDRGYPMAGPSRVDVLDRAACERGIQIMADKYPQHFADLVTENDDAITADVFIQCALFGDIIYG